MDPPLPSLHSPQWASLLQLHHGLMWLRRFAVLVRVYALVVFHIAISTAFCGMIWLGIPDSHNICQHESSPLLLVFAPSLLWCLVLIQGERHPDDVVLTMGYVGLLSVTTVFYTWCSDLPAILIDYTLVLTLWIACTGAVMVGDSFRAKRWELICSRVLTSVFFITLWVIGDQTVFHHQRILLYGYGAIVFLMMTVTFYGTRYIRDELPAAQTLRGSLLIYVGLVTMFKITLIVLSPNLWRLPWTTVFAAFRSSYCEGGGGS
ncbi:membrane protein US13 [Human betaherpesvirus 5]|uniref:Uncharacterized protein HVLF5 n=7 Tax=Human cytomegalovirus TaxID=10359 RepID=US13_HCMVA|nr:membrane protein US13 [Human betaherpesvirus 5]F5H9I4.1 RecName: Full=Membrane protein US13 [Human herpesvirus 5 strain Merlin]P09720.1 RecName: Full=Uncharacterized protein HVLF5 [Human herpesvirus 5 strain AD169]AMD82462.1 membrane protein US13 [synthetic construct]AVT50397.1 membrane protein US13 [synthetic human betaherpesvirus 5]WNA12840.1 membrane protein US13 [Cytomegalovirus humanbeta5]AAR31702.1 membrane protein US13 [Human betaherpesvirus 5]AAS49011.1 US13 [Human betaherpesvirus